MSSQKSRSSSVARDPPGSMNQHRLLDIAHGKPPTSSPTTQNNTSGTMATPPGAGSTSEAKITRNTSFSRDSVHSSPELSSRAHQSQLVDSASMHSESIDIPTAPSPAGSSSNHYGSPDGRTSSSGSGENQSPSLMSVLQGASSPPSVSYLAGVASPTPSLNTATPSSSGQRGGSSSSSDVGGAVPLSPGPHEPHMLPQSVTLPGPHRSGSGEECSSKEDDSSKSEPAFRGAASTPDPMHPSQSEPIFLKPGEASPLSEFHTPSREDRSPKSSKKKQKSSPWYSVLASTYKSKCEEFRKLFKTIPSNERLLMDYSCALQKDILVHGRMFITEGWLCFYANIFKWETMLTIRFKDVTAITKERTIRFIPNAIQISTDSEKYFFTSFMSREKSFLLLFRIWQNALLEQTMPSSEYWSWVHSNYGSDGGLPGAEEIPPDFMEREGLVDPLGDALGTGESTEEVSQSLASDEEEDASMDDVFSGSKEDSLTEDGDGLTMTVPSRAGQTEGDGILDAVADMEEAVDPLSTLDFGGKELVNETFNMPVDKLFTALYGKQHPFLLKFLEYRKCTDIEIGEWTRHDSDRDTRKLTYVLHLNTSLGYKACGVEENHMFQKNWSKTGQSYIVEKEVYNKNVPYCDYFYVHTCHVLTKITPTSSRLRFIMRIEFLKSALGLVKSFIERNVESGTKQAEKELVKYIHDTLETVIPVKKRKGKKRRSQHPNRDVEEKRRTDTQTQPSTQQGFLANLTPVWFQPKSESKLSLHSTMAFISVVLAVLCIFNVSLFLQLKSLEEGGAGKQVWSNAEFVKHLGELPKTEKDWTILLHQQQQMHAKEMQKWKDIVDLCIQLIKQMETTLSELHTGMASSDVIPNIQDLIESSVLEVKAETPPSMAEGG